jgi:hypothetical protein
VELLFPDGLLSKGAFIEKLVSIPEDNWENVEIIGWMYQYYISERKAEVFGNLKDNQKIQKEDIAPATQLFTPEWIVRYMVQNSLGRLWAEGHKTNLITNWQYYVEEAEQEAEVEAQLLEIREDIKNVTIKKKIKEHVETLLPKKRVGDFNQALMEIGATICLPNGKPLCTICPLNKYCLSYMNNSTLDVPLKRKRKTVPQEEKTVFILKYKNKYAIEKRESQGLLASMYQFPLKNQFFSVEEAKYLKLGIIMKIKPIGTFKHKFTHKEWLMKGYFIELSTNLTDYNFASYDDIKHIYTIPSAFNAFKKIIRGEENE